MVVPAAPLSIVTGIVHSAVAPIRAGGSNGGSSAPGFGISCMCATFPQITNMDWNVAKIAQLKLQQGWLRNVQSCSHSYIFTSFEWVFIKNWCWATSRCWRHDSAGSICSYWTAAYNALQSCLLGYYLQSFTIICNYLTAEILIVKHNRCYRLNKRVSGGVLVALINNVWSVVTNFNLLGWKRFVLIIIGMGQPGVFGVNQHSNCGRSAACHLEQAGLWHQVTRTHWGTRRGGIIQRGRGWYPPFTRANKFFHKCQQIVGQQLSEVTMSLADLYFWICRWFLC